MVGSMTRAGLLIVLFLTAFGPAVAHAADSMEIVYDDGRATEQVPLLRASGADGWYVRASDVARLLRATQFWNASSRKIVLGVGKARLVLTVDTRVVVADGEPVMMRSEVRYEDGAVLVPLEFIVEIANQYMPRGFAWDPDEKRLSLGGVGYNVTQVAVSGTGTRTSVTLHLSEPLLYHVDTATPGLVRLKLYGGRVDPKALEGGDWRRGLVTNVRSEHTDRDAFVAIHVSKDVGRLRVDREDAPPSLTVVLEKGSSAAADSLPEGTIEIVDADAGAPFVIDRVCVDAGHGGRDFGHEGTEGVLEKDINLAIARVVRDRVQDELGLEVVMTRDDDLMVDLVQRAEIANTSGCDLFVSIHCNSWFQGGAGGFESYFQAPGEVPAASSAQSTGAEVTFKPWKSVQDDFIAESSTFAEYVQRELASRLGIPSRGVKQASFVVLQGLEMPAVLIETAFLSNAREERMLNDPDFQRRVADGVVASIQKMRDRYR
jgi:N-acetylmuramoyl-L-alanine amidase